MSCSSKGRVEILITNINPEIKKDLKLIAKNKGTTVSDMLRPVLREIQVKNARFLKLED